MAAQQRAVSRRAEMLEEIPVQFAISGREYELINGRFIQVGGDADGDMTASAAALRAAELKVEELSRTNDSLSKRARKAETNAKELEYKYQLTLELLAVAQMEAEKYATELDREKLVTETLQHELVRITQGEKGSAPVLSSQPTGGSPRRSLAPTDSWRRR